MTGGSPIVVFDEARFRRLFDEYLRRVHDYISAIARSDYIAEEVTQELFIILWRKRDDLHEVQHMDQYIFRIARNLTINLLKKAARDRELAARLYKHELPSSVSLLGETDRKEAHRLIEQAVMALPPQARKIYLLSRRDHMDYDEMAAATGLSRNTVKNHLQRALQLIREHLVKNGYQPLVAAVLLKLLS